MNISFTCPSYKRPVVESLRYIPWLRVYVAPEEYEEYRKNNVDGEIIKCKPGVQGNVSRVRNYILETEFDAGADAVVIIDDDVEGFYLWVDGGKTPQTKQRLDTDILPEFFEKYTLLCSELGFYYWGANCNQDAFAYRAYTPFSFTSFLGGPLQVFLKGHGCKYDERLPLKEDYDMTIQQCNKHRGCLRLNFLMYNARQSEQSGGCAYMRNMQKEREQFLLLQKKWGSKIVKEDKSNKGGTKMVKRFDYNPIIKIPINGV